MHVVLSYYRCCHKLEALFMSYFFSMQAVLLAGCQPGILSKMSSDMTSSQLLMTLSFSGSILQVEIFPM